MSDSQAFVDIDALLAAQPQGQPTIDLDALMATPSGQNVAENMAPGDQPLFPISVEEGRPTDVGFWEELGASISLGGDKGRYALDRLKKMLPDRAVVALPDNDGSISSIAISEPGQDDVPIDKREFRTFKTGLLASAIPAAIKTGAGGLGAALSAAGGPVTAFLGGAAADAVGNAAVQTADQFLFPGDAASPNERLADIGTDVALGAAIPVGVAAAKGAVGGARRLVGAGSRRDMANRMARQSAEGGDDAAEALARSQDLGGALSPGRVTKATAQLDQEAAMRQFAKDTFDDIDLRNIEAARRGAVSVAERLGSAESAEAGTRIAMATENAQTAMETARGDAFKKSLDKASLVSSNAAVIPQSNVSREMASLLDEFGDSVTVNDDIEKAVRLLRRQSGRMQQGPIRIEKLQREMRALGRAVRSAKRGGKDFEAMVNQRLLDARRADLDEAIAADVPGANFLKEARDRYAAASREIEGLSEPILNRAGIDLDNARPEQVVKKLLSSATETSNRKVARILNKVDPGALRDARAAVVNSIVDGASEGGQFSLAKYARAIERNQGKLAGLFDGDVESLKMLNKVAKFAKDAQVKGGVGGPGARTNPLAMSVAALGGFVGKALDNVPVLKALPEFNRSQQAKFFAELVRNPAEMQKLRAAAIALRRNPRASNLSRVTELISRFVEDKTLRVGEDGAREFDFEGQRNLMQPIEVQDDTVDPSSLASLRGPLSPNFKPSALDLPNRPTRLQDLVR